MKVAPCVILLATCYLAVTGNHVTRGNDVIAGFEHVNVIQDHTRNGENFNVFTIKYANIPKNNPFHAPIGVNQDEHIVRDCKYWTNDLSENEDEDLQDCLLLHIKTKSIEGRKPVIVLIPGFNLERGTNREILNNQILDKDVVVVTVQYRAGPFGFLTTNTENIPGNVGLLDIIQALKWIQNNIHNFGGDNNRVTLVGNYKTAELMGALTVCPLADVLFQQVIYQSGSPILNQVTTNNIQKAVQFAKEVADECGCQNTNDVNDINKCLLHSHKGKIINAFRRVSVRRYGDVPLITIGGQNGIIPGTETIQERYEQGKFRKLNVIGGVVRDPALYIVHEYQKNNNDITNRHELINVLKDHIRWNFENDHDNVLEKLRHNNPQLANVVKNFLQLDVINDLDINAIIDLIGADIKNKVLNALNYNKQYGGRSYLYAFNYRGNKQRLDPKANRNFINLGDDHQYVFDDRRFNGRDEKIVDIMTDLWYTFAKDGVPRAHNVAKWPKLTDNYGPYLIIDSNDVRIDTDYSKQLCLLLRCKVHGECRYYNIDSYKVGSNENLNYRGRNQLYYNQDNSRSDSTYDDELLHRIHTKLDKGMMKNYHSKTNRNVLKCELTGNCHDLEGQFGDVKDILRGKDYYYRRNNDACHLYGSCKEDKQNWNRNSGEDVNRENGYYRKQKYDNLRNSHRYGGNYYGRKYGKYYQGNLFSTEDNSYERQHLNIDHKNYQKLNHNDKYYGRNKYYNLKNRLDDDSGSIEDPSLETKYTNKQHDYKLKGKYDVNDFYNFRKYYDGKKYNHFGSSESGESKEHRDYYHYNVGDNNKHWKYDDKIDIVRRSDYFGDNDDIRNSKLYSNKDRYLNKNRDQLDITRNKYNRYGKDYYGERYNDNSDRKYGYQGRKYYNFDGY